MASKNSYISIAVICLALLFAVIAIATPHWLEHNSTDNGEDTELYVGLFQLCHRKSGYCGDMEELYRILDEAEVPWFHAIQVTYTLTVIGSLACAVMSGLVTCRFFETPTGYKPITIMNFFTFSIALFPIIVMARQGNGMFILDSWQTSLSWSFWMAVVGEVWLFLAFILHGIEAYRVSRANNSIHQRITVWNRPYSVFHNEVEA